MVGLQGQVSLLELTTAQIDFEGSPGAAGDRRGSHPDEEAARARQRQARRKGSRRARRDGGAAAAAPPPVPAPLQVFAMQSLGEAIVTTDIEGRLAYLNPAAEKLLGVLPRAGRRPAARGRRRPRRPERSQAALRPGQGSDRRRQWQPAQFQPPGRVARQGLGGGARHRARRIAIARMKAASSLARSSSCTTSPSCAACIGRCRTRRRTMR